jgi:hypothetical protein
MENIDILKEKAKQLFAEVNRATANLKEVIEEFDNVQTEIKAHKHTDLKARFTPIVREMFKLNDKLVCAYIGNDHRIFFAEVYPWWDTNTQQWMFSGKGTHAKVCIPPSRYNMSVAIGVDTTMISKNDREYFIWTLGGN